MFISWGEGPFSNLHEDEGKIKCQNCGTGFYMKQNPDGKCPQCDTKATTTKDAKLNQPDYAYDNGKK